MLVYLIHFEKKISHAQHYVGATYNLRKRLQQHARGEGAKILRAAREKKIKWRVARVWTAGYDVESKLKKIKNTPKYCPICNVRPSELRGLDCYPLNLIATQLESYKIYGSRTRPIR